MLLKEAIMGKHDLRISEEFTVHAPIGVAREFMRNPEKMAPCMPGVASVEPRDERTYDVVVAAQVVVKTAMFQMRAEVTHEDATHLEGTAAGDEVAGDGRIDVLGRLDLTAVDEDQTKVSFVLEGSVEGKMMHVGTGPAISFQARHMAKQFVSEVKERIEASVST
jgi:carbon monoxide dehydrogenase subunit G